MLVIRLPPASWHARPGPVLTTKVYNRRTDKMSYASFRVTTRELFRGQRPSEELGIDKNITYIRKESPHWGKKKKKKVLGEIFFIYF